MSGTRRAAASVLTAMGALVAFGILPAATPASADSGIPADCNVTPSGITISMTCTARPASQTWQLETRCVGFKPYYLFGNEVTGDGTSTVRECVNFVRAFFIIDS